MSARRTRALGTTVVAIALAFAAVASADTMYEQQLRADLEADVQKRIGYAREEFGNDVPLRVESGIFVIYAAERGVDFDAAADFAQRALDVYFGSFFARRPDRAVSVALVRTSNAFMRRYELSAHYEGELGAYSRRTREILVNVGPGLPTISHELIHPLVQTDFPRIPAWFDEGIAALFEKPVFEPAGEMHGANNWRYERLARAVRSPAERGKVHLPALFALDNDTVDREDQALHYAEARALCQWLDEHGQLWPFYRAWRDGVASDPSGEKSFERITGMTPEQADATWLTWVKTLR